MWTFIFFLIMIALGLPILAMIYNTFTSSTNGSWLNWTTTCGTAMYTTYELGWFQLLPILATLMGLAFLLILLSGYFKKQAEQQRPPYQ